MDNDSNQIKETENSVSEDNIDCSICFECFTNTESIHILECNHMFHSSCLYGWYSKPGSNYNCPLCMVQREVIKII